MEDPKGTLRLGVRHSAARVITAAGLLAAVVCTALQIWRPYFFLTNDNLTQWMPPMVEIARNLDAGQPPFISASLFGGGYDWRTDGSVFPLVSPLLPLLSPLAAGSWYYCLIDVITTFEFLVVAVGFAAAGVWLRERHDLQLSDGAIVVATLSYTFSPLMLLFGSSWMGFVNAQAAWPLIFIALQFSSAWRSVPLMSAAFAFSLFGGNLHPFVFLLAGSGIFAFYFAVNGRTVRPLLCVGGSLACVALMAWWLIGAAGASMLEMGQFRHFSTAKSSFLNVAPPALFASLAWGPLAAWTGGPAPLFGAGAAWSAGIAYSIVNLPTLLALIRGGWRRKFSRLPLLAAIVVVLLIWRPAWLAELLAITPAFRSTRWPFREVVVLLFFVHLLFILNYRPLARPWNAILWVVALLPMTILFAAGPPSMGNSELSRRLILSGVAVAYWKSIDLVQGSQASLVCTKLDNSGALDAVAPFPLLPSHNFPALFGVRSVGGYSTGSPLLLDRARLLAPAASSIYTAEQARVYLDHFPHSRLTILQSVEPPTWSVVTAGRERRFSLDPASLQIRELPVE